MAGDRQHGPFGCTRCPRRSGHRPIPPPQPSVRALIYVLYPIPKVVFVPIILLILGIGDLPKIVLIFLILFFQIVVLVRDQAATSPPN